MDDKKDKYFGDLLPSMYTFGISKGEEVEMLDSEVGNKTSNENKEMSGTKATSWTDGDKEMEVWTRTMPGSFLPQGVVLAL